MLCQVLIFNWFSMQDCETPMYDLKYTDDGRIHEANGLKLHLSDRNSTGYLVRAPTHLGLSGRMNALSAPPPISLLRPLPPHRARPLCACSRARTKLRRVSCWQGVHYSACQLSNKRQYCAKLGPQSKLYLGAHKTAIEAALVVARYITY